MMDATGRAYDLHVFEPGGKRSPLPIPEEAPDGARSFPFVLYRDIAPEPRKDFLVEDLIADGELSIVFGAPGCGKSVLVGDVGCHVAAGLSWHGKAVRRCGVLYIAAERHKLVERRFAAFRRHRQIDDIPIAVLQAAPNLCSGPGDAKAVIATIRQIEAATGVPIEWVIVDTFARVLATGDENSGRDVGAVITNLAAIQSATGAHVTVVHHVPHAEQTRMRGHGALLGAADITLRVEKDDATALRTATVDKVNDGLDDVKFAFRLESVTLSTDPDTGKATTAPIVMRAEPPGQTRTKKSVRLKPAEEIALRVLRDIAGEIGKPLPPSWHMPRDLIGVAVEAWRNACYAGQIAESEKQDTRLKAFARAALSLQQRNLIGVRDDIVWLV